MRKRTVMSVLMLIGTLCFAGLAEAQAVNGSVPEPGSMLLLGSALAGVAAAYKKFKK